MEEATFKETQGGNTGTPIIFRQTQGHPSELFVVDRKVIMGVLVIHGCPCDSPIPLSGGLYFKEKKKRGGVSKDSVSLYYSKKSKQPWLLVSHLPPEYNTPKKIVKLYGYRMQIEEAFRDTKNQQYGLGLAQAKSKSAKRYNNLLLIAALTLFLLWCIGQAAIENKYHYKLQANTVRNKIVLSNIYLAMQIVSDPRYEVDEESIKNILENIFNFTQNLT